MRNPLTARWPLVLCFTLVLSCSILQLTQSYIHGQQVPHARAAADTNESETAEEHAPPAMLMLHAPSEDDELQGSTTEEPVRPLTAKEVRATFGRSLMEISLSLAVLLFGLIVTILHFILMYRARKYWDDQALRVFAMILSVTGSLLLITAGFSSEQILPVSTLLSGMLGYSFGGNSRNPPASETKKEKDQNEQPSKPEA